MLKANYKFPLKSLLMYLKIQFMLCFIAHFSVYLFWNEEML